MIESAVVVGAGPRVAAVAHLRSAGVKVRSFGDPLEFWRRQMPEGMMLRSRKRSSDISDPGRNLTIEQFERDQGRRVHTPNMLLEEFIDFGTWFQSRAVPDLDHRKMIRLSHDRDVFQLELSDGEQIEAARVIVAAGLAPFPSRPPLFAALPASLVSHSSEHEDFTPLSGKRVVVIGAGQSALESAVLLCERGPHVEVLIRRARSAGSPTTTPSRRGGSRRPMSVGGSTAGSPRAGPISLRLA